MPDNRIVKWGGIAIAVLVLANIVSYFYNNWGLITVKVHDAPLSKVIKSIEWQGWVKIYTNLPPDTKVSMYVDHVPLAEAMETLAANVSGPPRGADQGPGRDGGDRPSGGNPPPNGAPGANASVAGGSPRGPGNFDHNRPPGGGRGGFGEGGVQWNLAFFVAPTTAQVKKEIQDFEAGTPDDDTRVYVYGTPLQFIGGEDISAADPRKQNWPGYKQPQPPPPPAPDASGQTPPPPPIDPPTVQTYLRAFAEGSNIWIMTPGAWDTAATAPGENSSIARAMKSFISSAHGSVTQAIILRAGRGGHGPPRGSGGGGSFNNMDAMADRLRNAVNGLPDDEQPAALEMVNQEVAFYQQVRTAPPDQQASMMQSHIADKMANANNGRRSPEKRAQRYAQMVSNRQAAQGKK